MSTSRQEHEDRLAKKAESDYAQHQITHRDVLSWELRKPGTANLAARLIVVPWRVIVVGDGPDLIFRNNERGEVGLRWLASGGLDYLVQKVVASEAREWLWEVALDRINEYAQTERRESDDPDTWVEPEWIEEARQGVSSGDWDHRRLYEHVHAATEDFELPIHWGFAVSLDVVRARAIAKRLVALLEAERAQEAQVAHR